MKTVIDLVICGPDMSGTGTQTDQVMDYFERKNYKVKDLRGDEIAALFHADKFKKYNENFRNILQFKKSVSDEEFKNFLSEAYSLIYGASTNADLQIASCVDNECSTFINPDSADVWVLEEPTKRGVGQENRALEQNRSRYDSQLDPLQATYSHSSYRVYEFLRFRRVLRENKIIIRSRSEESACYQIFDEVHLKNGVSRDFYFNLPGHEVAFKHAPTHLFVVCAGESWTAEQYLAMKQERSKGRFVDDHESNVNYQLLVNRRYSSSWLEELYKDAQKIHKGSVPEIHRFSIYDSIPVIEKKFCDALDKILEQN